MNENLVSQIKRTYPDGLLSGRDDSTLDSAERDERIRGVILTASKACLLSSTIEPFNKPSYSITFTQNNHPPFETWIWLMRNPEKLAWIKSNNGNPYPAFWLKISRVADYYDCFYNHWVPRGDTGYLDADCKREPSELWKGYERIIRDSLDRNGFEYFTDELAQLTVPFVLDHDYDSIPNNDPRWNDDAFEPPLVPASLYECLFSL